MGRFTSDVGSPGRIRPIAIVACDAATSVERGARHLVEDLRVPAIVGFHRGADVTDHAPTLFFPNGVLIVATLTTSPLVTALPQPSGPRLVWRTTYSVTQTAAPLSRFIEQVVEPKVRADTRAVAPASPIRVALLRSKAPGPLAFSQALFSELRFNRKSALDNGHDFREVTVGVDAKDEASRAVDDLLAFAPHVVVMMGGDEMSRDVIEPLEAKWRAPARPYYVAMSVLPPRIFSFVGGSAERRRRIFGLTTESTTLINARLVMHYNEAFRDGMSRTTSANSSYDAFYMVAYATYASQGAEITGPSLSRAFARLLPPGKPVDVGPLGIFDAVSTLQSGANIDLNGAMGKLDFDPATGEAPINAAILCVDVDRAGRAVDSVESGLVYDATSKTLKGAMKCP